MNKKLYNILFQIYESPYSMTTIFLAEKLNISERMLINDINKLNEVLSRNNLGVIKIENGYIRYYGDNIGTKEYLENLDFYEYALSKEERVIIEVLLLLFTQDKVILSDMADIMQVSRSTVIGDRDALQEFVVKNGLVLYTKSNYGIQIKGLESDIRKLYIKLLFQERNLVQMFLNQKFPIDIIDTQFQLIEKYDKALQSMIIESEILSNITLTENSNWVLKQYIKFYVYRMKRELYVDNSLFFNSINSYSSVLIDNLYPLVLDFFKLKECLSEKCLLKYLAQYFRYTSDTMEVFVENILETQTIVRKFIENVSIDLNLPIYKDYELFENLSLHLDRIFGRKRTELILYPEVNKVIDENLYIKKVVSENISILEEHLNITMTETEIAYIVIYICASVEKLKHQLFDANIVIVCNSGFGTSQLLKYKLEERFQFNIKKIIPAHNLEKESQKLLKDIDFIISTVYLDIDFPYVKTSPLLTERDVININSMLLKLETVNINNRESQYRQKILLNKIKTVCQPYDNLYEAIKPVIEDYLDNENDCIYLSSLLSEEFIEVDVESDDWKDSIRKASIPLLENDFITENYMEAMIDNCEKNGPYFVIAPNFAIPHASIEAGSKKLGMSLIRLKNPVSFNAGELDPVKYLCVISAIDNNKHLKATFNLINLLKIKDFRNAMDEAIDSNEVSMVIKNFERTLI